MNLGGGSGLPCAGRERSPAARGSPGQPDPPRRTFLQNRKRLKIQALPAHEAPTNVAAAANPGVPL
ncbi:MAG: hypothetical protein AMXMBFR4_30130 [Candidatus Hydrogenedentota bacterium]